ncbi:PocR ligand-binding domain-containing protein [Luteolibacter algae]|uniref:PocR ligand-binding domain-containing protein n=1 Tax=Luteolibacter algae TaxID=454151 RepID=A0ABW5D475_9BACT
MTSDPDHFNHALQEKVLKSELFTTYQNAFRCATGLPLRFVHADADISYLCEQAENSSSFCDKLNLCESACKACMEVNRRLNEDAKINGPTTCHCFSGMTSTAVPVMCGGAIIGMLRTGQVFHKTPDEQTFSAVAKTLSRQGLKPEDVKALHDAWFKTQVIDPERYQAMVNLLVTFGKQLSSYAEKLALISDGSEPAAVARARKFIENTLADPLPLSLVAKHAGLSESHFCRVFKESTGLTLTDYVNRRRIEWAKKELLKPEARVSEIAFHIGYQSLSQFNRSFARFTGNSPTNFRREELAKATSLSAGG